MSSVGHILLDVGYVALNTLAAERLLVTQVHHVLLKTAMASQGDTGRSFVDRILLALLVHCSRDQEHGKAIKAAESALARKDLCAPCSMRDMLFLRHT